MQMGPMNKSESRILEESLNVMSMILIFRVKAKLMVAVNISNYNRRIHSERELKTLFQKKYYIQIREFDYCPCNILWLV